MKHTSRLLVPILAVILLTLSLSACVGNASTETTAPVTTAPVTTEASVTTVPTHT